MNKRQALLQEEIHNIKQQIVGTNAKAVSFSSLLFSSLLSFIFFL
jgi:hypothetical protein